MVSSRTTLLSLGDLPVLTPELTLRAPVSVIVVSKTVWSPRLALWTGYKAYSYSSDTLKN